MNCHPIKLVFTTAFALILMGCVATPTRAGFRVKPYLLASQPGGVTVVWFSNEQIPGELLLEFKDGFRTYGTTPHPAEALTYHSSELGLLQEGVQTTPPFKHAVHILGLHPGTRYNYRVRQGGQTHKNTFTTAPSPDSDVSFVVFADSETEPESTGKPTSWPVPGGNVERVYPVDQTEGFIQNLRMIQSREPGFIAFAGDIAQSGGEQRDWDELWRHISGDLGDIGAAIPIVAAPGNHDSYGGPGEFGGFEPEAHRRAADKFRTYFSALPDAHHPPGDYHRLDFGPITLISLDSTNGLPDRTERDTSWNLTGRDAEHDFNPGSAQYRWLETQLADAQKNSAFTFVQFHHVPYSVGPHGFKAGARGHAHGEDSSSGVPMRALTDLFMRYGVDAVFAGHDEMYEHSLIPGGVEQLPGGDGATRPHKLHVYDVGIAGDGLRGPFLGPDSQYPESDNHHQIYLAHLDAPEVWDGKRLVSGGKHYGHLEVKVTQPEPGRWQAVLTPAYNFPLMNDQGEVTGWERRVYDDEVTLTAEPLSP
jgi:Calcineurin-like phosphoesterase/Purple acid Phosphatase, N-terminal domain